MRPLSIASCLAVLAASMTAFGAAQELPMALQDGLDQARRESQAGRGARAIAVYRRLIVKWPAREAFQGLADALLKAHEPKEALEVLSQGLAAVPGDRALMQAAASVALELRQGTRALEIANEAVGLFPSDAPLRSIRATALVATGRVAEGIEEQQRAVALLPRDPRLAFNLGVLFHEAHRLEDAINAFRVASELDRGFVKASYNLGSVLYEAGRGDEAIATYAAALAPSEARIRAGRAIDAFHGTAFANFGSMQLARGDWRSAASAFEYALRADPALSSCQVPLGIARYRAGDWQGAERVLEDALKSDRTQSKAYVYLAAIAIDHFREADASKWLSQGLPFLSPHKRSVALLLLGQLAERAGDAGLAETHFAKAQGEHPSDPRALVGLARIRRSQRRLNEADEALEGARALGRDHPSIGFESAELALARGDNRRAVQEFDALLERADLASTAWLVHLRKGVALISMDDLRAARSELLAAAGAAEAAGQHRDGVVAARILAAVVSAADGNPELARTELLRVLAATPASAAARQGLAAVEMLQSPSKDAASQMSRIATALQTPLHPAVEMALRVNLGELRRRAGLSGASEEFARALSAGSRVEPALALGSMAVRSRDYSRAITLLAAAKQACENPDPPIGAVVIVSSTRQASLCTAVGVWLDAAIVGEAARELTDQLEAHAVARVRDSVAEGRLSNATPPSHFAKQALLLHGTAALVRGDLLTAKADFRNALRGPLSRVLEGIARNNLGIALFELGARREAADELVHARTLGDRASAATLNLALALEGSNGAAAARLYDEYLKAGGPRATEAQKRLDRLGNLYP